MLEHEHGDIITIPRIYNIVIDSFNRRIMAQAVSPKAMRVRQTARQEFVRVGKGGSTIRFTELICSNNGRIAATRVSRVCSETGLAAVVRTKREDGGLPKPGDVFPYVFMRHTTFKHTMGSARLLH